MPCIWGQHNGSHLYCAVGILPATPAHLAGTAPKQFAPNQFVAVQALIDTGATTTCVSRRHATAIKMQPFGKLPVHGVGGAIEQNGYLFYVGFPFALPGAQMPVATPTPTPVQVVLNVFILDRAIEGCEFNNGNANFDVLLGMDVLSTGSLVVQGGTNTFSFAF